MQQEFVFAPEMIIVESEQAPVIGDADKQNTAVTVQVGCDGFQTFILDTPVALVGMQTPAQS